MEQLIQFIEICLNVCRNLDPIEESTPETKKALYDQAFGATQLYSLMRPENDNAIDILWNENY